MRTALLASTVTPGSTAPVVSLTRPAMLLACCCADAGETTSVAKTTSIRQTNLDVVTDRISITDDRGRLFPDAGDMAGGSKLLRSLPQNQHVSIFLGLRSRAKGTGHDEDERIGDSNIPGRLTGFVHADTDGFRRVRHVQDQKPVWTIGDVHERAPDGQPAAASGGGIPAGEHRGRRVGDIEQLNG